MQDKFVDIDGIGIRYRDAGGDGRPVLFIHGIAGSLEMWRRQLGQFDPSIRTIALDLPGHGLSDIAPEPQDADVFARFVWRFVNALEIDTITIVGNSLGGAIGLRMAGMFPARVTGLMLANAATLGRDVFFAFRLMTLPLLGELLNRPGQVAVEQQLRALFHDPGVVTPEIREVVTRNVQKPGAGAAFLTTLRRMTGLRGQKASFVETSHRLLRDLRLPCIILHGRQDTVLPVQQALDAAKLVPAASLVILEECGHTPQIEKPDAFNQMVLQLLEMQAGTGMPA
ncbi:alpha/beta fold hydrolase [Rhizobium sp. FKL33]|uniref:alpha/beta fold hydrolase n=1 Tax=Rhizobium sp. FKL33 TaxID=2562307 RepID=UPI0010BFB002|nr:alpha/beta fold hydrolase [Rhizobium sp. FKL33]